MKFAHIITFRVFQKISAYVFLVLINVSNVLVIKQIVLNAQKIIIY